MANYLKMAKASAILTLKEHGWSQRRIARELGIHPDTVGKYVHLTAPFSPPGDYNHYTTVQPLICQYPQNVHLVSALITAIYKKVKISQRIQWPCPARTTSGCLKENLCGNREFSI